MALSAEFATVVQRSRQTMSKILQGCDSILTYHFEGDRRNDFEGDSRNEVAAI